MRVTFVYLDESIGNEKKFYLGIAYLSAVLKENGHQTSLIHISGPISEKEFVKKLAEFSPDIVAFSAISNMFPKVRPLFKWAKKHLKVITICGGTHATIAPEEVIKERYLDMLCIGEGEGAIVELCNAIGKGGDFHRIRNLWVKKTGRVYRNPVRPLIENLEELPTPDFEVFGYEDLADYIRFHRAVIMASRGCPYNCTYCCNHKIKAVYPNSNRYVRYIGVDRVLKDLKKMVDRYPGIDNVRFLDDTLTLNRRWFEKFVKKYPKEIGLPFTCNARANEIDEKIAKMLKKVGCIKIEMGIESGNELLRNKILNRNMSDKQILTAFGLFRRYGIKTSAFNIIGLPFETISNILDTIKINAKSAPDWSYVFFFHPFKHTRLYETCKNEGFLTKKVFGSIYEGPTLEQPSISRYQTIFAFKYFRLLVRLYKVANKFPGTVSTAASRVLDIVLTSRLFPYRLFVWAYPLVYYPLAFFYKIFATIRVALAPRSDK